LKNIRSGQNLKGVTPELEMFGISMIMQWNSYLMTAQGNGFGTVEYVTTATKDYGYAECEY
jgi:hypothetical protein